MSGAMRSLRLESLEPKQMLAGDVVVDVVNGMMTLEGDDLANQVAIVSGEEAGSYVVRGLQGTTIRMADADPNDPGAPESGLVVEGARRGMRARLGEGDDSLNINDANFRGSVAINMGEGDDTVSIGVGRGNTDPPTGEPGPPAEDDGPAVGVRRNVTIRTGDGNDDVIINNTNIRGRLVISTGAGEDGVRIGRPEATTPPGDGDGGGDDDGDEPTRESKSVRVGSLRAELGADNDTMRVSNTAAGHLRVNGGGGEDGIRIGGTHARTISVSGGRGEVSDEVVIRDSVARTVFASLGDGDDSLTLNGVKAGRAMLLGGAGEGDVLNLLGENMIRRQRVFGFEEINETDSDDDSEG